MTNEQAQAYQASQARSLRQPARATCQICNRAIKPYPGGQKRCAKHRE